MGAASLYLEAAGFLDDASPLRESCYNNAALCFLKSGKPVDAIANATKAIADEPKNSKALYRRAMAYMEVRFRAISTNRYLCPIHEITMTNVMLHLLSESMTETTS